MRRQLPRAAHTRTGPHRPRGETTKPVERSHAPVKDRLRAMRGRRSVATGQRVLEAVEAAPAGRRGARWRVPGRARTGAGAADGARARKQALTFLVAAPGLRLPGSPPAGPAPARRPHGS